MEVNVVKRAEKPEVSQMEMTGIAGCSKFVLNQNDSEQQATFSPKAMGSQRFGTLVQETQPPTSEVVGFSDLSVQNSSDIIGQLEVILSRKQYSILKQEIQITLKKEDRKQFRQRRSSKLPKYCWTVLNGVLTPSMNCKKDCCLHMMRSSQVSCLIKHNSRYKHLVDPLQKYKKKLINSRIPPTPPQKGGVEDLDRMLANSHIDANRDAYRGFPEMVEKMEGINIQDFEMDEE